MARVWFGMLVTLGLMTACGPGAAVPLQIVLLPFEAVLPPLTTGDEEQTPEEAAAEEAKRRNANEQTRLTGARLEREKIAAANAHWGSDSAVSAAVSPEALPPDPGAPEQLDVAMIRAGMAVVAPQAMLCRVPGVTGQVLTEVKVDPSGAIRTITITHSPDPQLASCVADAVRAAKFAATVKGGRFRYPLVF